MKKFLKHGVFFKMVLISFLSLSLAGCAVNLKKTPPEEVRQAKRLKQEVQQLGKELKYVKTEKEREIQRLKKAKASLEEKLQKEMQEKNVKLDISDRGLVITLLDRVLFDPGKAKLKTDSFGVLDKVANVLKNQISDKDIGIEGHTDNQPIKYSPWKSNWELSTARALSVLHYFEDKGMNSERMTVIGYGPYRPIASNETAEGRQKNRRVEIVILPEVRKKEKVLEKENYEGIK